MFFHHIKIVSCLRNKILGDIEAGEKPTVISVPYGCHISSIYQVMNKFVVIGSADDPPRTGRLKVTNPRQGHAIATVFCREPCSTANEVARAPIGNHGHRVSEPTVCFRIHGSDRYCHCPVKMPFLMAHHRPNRINWAQLHMNWRLMQWRRVLFSDECRVCVNLDERENPNLEASRRDVCRTKYSGKEPLGWHPRHDMRCHWD